MSSRLEERDGTGIKAIKNYEGSIDVAPRTTIFE